MIYVHMYCVIHFDTKFSRQMKNIKIFNKVKKVAEVIPMALQIRCYAVIAYSDVCLCRAVEIIKLAFFKRRQSPI